MFVIYAMFPIGDGKVMMVCDSDKKGMYSGCILERPVINGIEQHTDKIDVTEMGGGTYSVPTMTEINIHLSCFGYDAIKVEHGVDLLKKYDPINNASLQKLLNAISKKIITNKMNGKGSM